MNANEPSTFWLWDVWKGELTESRSLARSRQRYNRLQGRPVAVHCADSIMLVLAQPVLCFRQYQRRVRVVQ